MLWLLAEVLFWGLSQTLSNCREEGQLKQEGQHLLTGQRAAKVR